MTTHGCQLCPSEEVIRPLRNVASTFAVVLGLVLWFLYSWSPFFPRIGAEMSRIMIAVTRPFLKSGKVSGLSKFVTNGIHYLGKLRLPQYFKIFISYLQVMSSFMDFYVPWPAVLMNAMLWFKATLNFNVLSMPGVSCLWKGLHYNDKLVSYTAVPLGLIFMLFIPLLAIFILKKCQVQMDKDMIATVQDRCWNAVMFLCFLVREDLFSPVIPIAH
jgi:hypothetical protein